MIQKIQSSVGPVLSIGSINADFQLRVARRPAISETLIGSDFTRLGGGKAANVAWLVQQLGVAVRLFGCVGDDELATQALASLDAAGIDLSDVCKVRDCATGVAVISVPPDGKKGIILAPNANETWSDAHIELMTKAISDSLPGAVLVLDCEIPIAVATQAVLAARKRGCLIILDPSPADRVTEQLIAAADVITPNPAEATQLTGRACEDVDAAVAAAVHLREQGAASVCFKLSDGGCVLAEPEGLTHIGTVTVDVVDTTGAGDAFAGALAVCLAEERALPDAARFAAAAAHVTVGVYGSRIPNLRRDVIERMQERLPQSRL